MFFLFVLCVCVCVCVCVCGCVCACVYSSSAVQIFGKNPKTNHSSLHEEMKSRLKSWNASYHQLFVIQKYKDQEE